LRLYSRFRREFRGVFALFATTVSAIATDHAAGRAGPTSSAACAVARPEGMALVYQQHAYATNQMLA